MITQSVIMAVLIGIVITGVIPFIGGIVLLVSGKIRGTSFWAGVLAFIIAMIATAIVGAILAIPLMNMIQTNPMMFNAISMVITGVCMALAMGICIGACMKRNNFNGALSCGLGFGTGYSVTVAIGLISTYATAAMINSGQFDAMYSAALDQGVITKEQLYELKSQFIELTTQDVIAQTVATIGLAAAMVGCAVFIMRGKCSKNLALGIISSVIIISIDGIASMIPNPAAAAVLPAAIGIAALIFAFRMKDKVVQEQKPAVTDSFLESIEKVQNDQEQD